MHVFFPLSLFLTCMSWQRPSLKMAKKQVRLVKRLSDSEAASHLTSSDTCANARQNGYVLCLDDDGVTSVSWSSRWMRKVRDLYFLLFFHATKQDSMVFEHWADERRLQASDRRRSPSRFLQQPLRLAELRAKTLLKRLNRISQKWPQTAQRAELHWNMWRRVFTASKAALARWQDNSRLLRSYENGKCCLEVQPPISR